MPSTRKLTGIAALSAASLATLVPTTPVLADHEEDCRVCVPGVEVAISRLRIINEALSDGSPIKLGYDLKANKKV